MSVLLTLFITQQTISDSGSKKPWVITKLYPCILSGNYRMNLLVYSGRNELIEVLPIRLSSDSNREIEVTKRDIEMTNLAYTSDTDIVQDDI